MHTYTFDYTEEEVLAVRDALSDEWFEQFKHVRERGKSVTVGAERRLRVLEALLDNAKEVCGKIK